MKPVVIIPALNPDEKLIALVKSLCETKLKVIVINDGSDSEYLNIFETLKSDFQCDVCHHQKNKGKGAALKTGIRYAAFNYPEASGYVTADADGQHTTDDIREIADYVERYPGSLILGTRDFNRKKVPFKSYCGNRITSFVYLLYSGRHCEDTQTGLRGIPREFKGLCLSAPGDKYEYEMNMLLEMGRKKIPFICVPIDTIYIENNASSHFNPIRDSVIIYFNILRYSISSLISALTDLSLFTLFVSFVFGAGSSGILTSTLAARLMSGTLNFTVNKFWVFQSRKRSTLEAVEYFTLFCFQMMMSWLLVTALSSLPLNLTLIKIAVDTGLFFISYQIQRGFIFNEKTERNAVS